MAYTDETEVLKWSSTLILPNLSVSIPNSSRPRFFVTGLLPVLTNTTSASNFSTSPPFDGSRERVTPSGETAEDVTFVESLNFIPCFFRILNKFEESSLSIVGVIESRNSITVTSVPNRLQTDPISSPITPPPITAIVLGILSSTRAPVESTIFFPSLSTGQGGRGLTSDPTARMMLFPVISCEPPVDRFTATELGPDNFAHPFT
mmetsp:Transcript_39869/g.40661  ORF Transcript_39869/g.40661 Transcript_39869/m.40661 type:complete len:205 (-) Transcript_39869:496-1110(-)